MKSIATSLCFALMMIGCSDPDAKATNNQNNQNNLNNLNNQSNNLNNQTNNANNTNSVCPSAVPSGACTTDTLICEYGDDPRPGCRTRAECSDAMWLVSAPDCEPIPDATCPATRQEADLQDCDPEEAICSYGDLDCVCSKCDDTGPVVTCGDVATWHCESPNPDTECPEGRPTLGDVCSLDGKVCTYRCGEEGGVECRLGAWQPTDGGPCPISTRTLKTEIRYLEADDVAAVSDALLRLRLAEYRYRDAGLPAGRQLGIIIEDAPGSYAVDERARMVDLYGRASMLLADAKEKERRIEALEETVRRLEARSK